MLGPQPQSARPARLPSPARAWLVGLGVLTLALLPGTAQAASQQPGAPASAAVAADDIRANQQWVLGMLNVVPAWPRSEGAGVTVAVIDSGVDPDVSDLSGSVTTGPDYTGVSTSPASQDWGVHGTWMASLIAGHGHDGGGSGVIGVAPQARILSIRVIPDRADPHYGKYEREQENRIQQSLANGINYAVAHGAQVISMSIGYGAPSGTVRTALQHAYDHDVVVLASAGNSGDQAGSGRKGQAPESFPADYPGVISVGAVKASGAVASFSSDNLSVQVAAPGVSIPAQGRDGQYWWVSGTSPACALVAGVAALIESRYPGLAPDLVATALTSTTTYRPPGGYDSQLGFGVVDATAALTKAGTLARARPTRPSTPAPIATRTGAGSSVTGSGARTAATAKFHGTIPAEPVPPRGPGQLVLFALLALASLVLTAAAATRLAFIRRSRR
ncbi:MAG: S8 family serine peptidase [Actinomycetota bacterium]|nr:S8 family serine peptidase [Actinomycetota bacterium]